MMRFITKTVKKIAAVLLAVACIITAAALVFPEYTVSYAGVRTPTQAEYEKGSDEDAGYNDKDLDDKDEDTDIEDEDSNHNDADSVQNGEKDDNDEVDGDNTAADSSNDSAGNLLDKITSLVEKLSNLVMSVANGSAYELTSDDFEIVGSTEFTYTGSGIGYSYRVKVKPAGEHKDDFEIKGSTESGSYLIETYINAAGREIYNPHEAGTYDMYVTATSKDESKVKSATVKLDKQMIIKKAEPLGIWFMPKLSTQSYGDVDPDNWVTIRTREGGESYEHIMGYGDISFKLYTSSDCKEDEEIKRNDEGYYNATDKKCFIGISLKEGDNVKASDGPLYIGFIEGIDKAANEVTKASCSNIVCGETPAPSLELKTRVPEDSIHYKYSTSYDGSYEEWDTDNKAGTYYIEAVVDGDNNIEGLRYIGTKDKPFSLQVSEGDMAAGVKAAGYSGVYDGQGHGISVTLSGAAKGATISYSTSSTGNYNLSENPSFTDAGSYTVYYKVSKSGYKDVTGSASVYIDAAPLTITADNKTVSYNEDAPVYTLSYSGLVNGETSDTALSKQPGISCNYKKGSAVRTYTIKVSGAEARNNNYDINYVSGTLTVNSGDMSGGVTVSNYSGVYDGGGHSISVSLSGPAAGAKIRYGTIRDGQYDLEENPYFNDAGSCTVYYKISKEGYTDITGSADVEIDAAPLTITADNKTVSYNDEAPAYTLSYKGFVNGETSDTALSKQPDISCKYKKGSLVRTYTIKVSGAEAKNNNYDINYVSGTLTVETSDMSEGITVSNYSGDYDGNAHGISVILSGAAEGATISYSTSGSNSFDLTENPTYTDAGNHTVYYKVSKAGYDDVTGSADVEIDAAPLTITADNKTVSFNEEAPVYTLNYKGFVNGETEKTALSKAPIISCDYAKGSVVRTYTIKVSGAEAKNNNYDINYISGILSVETSDEMAAGVAVSSYGGTYDGQEHSINVSLSGAAKGAKISYSTSGSDSFNLAIKPTYKDAGSYTVYYKVSKDGYNDVTGSASIDIDAAPLTITADDKTVSYNDEAPAYTLSYKGFVNGETEKMALSKAPIISCKYAKGSSVRTYTIKVSGAEATNNNYDINYVSGTLTVKSADMSAGVAVSSYNGTYDGKAHGISISLSKAAEGAAISYSTSGTDSFDLTENPSYTDVGSHMVYYKVSKAGYEDVIGEASIDIVRATLTITADNKTVSYNEDAPTYTFSYKGFVNGETGTTALSKQPDISCRYKKGSAVRTYTIKVSGAEAANYDIIYVSGILTVENAGMLDGVTVSSYSGTYDGKAYGISVALSGAAEGAKISYSTSGSDSFDLTDNPSYTDAGSYVVYYRVSKDGYEDVIGEASIDIDAAALTITADNKTVKYGSEAPEYTVSYEGFVNGETAKTALSKAPVISCDYTKGSQARTYTINVDSAEGANYDIGYISGILTVEKDDDKEDEDDKKDDDKKDDDKKEDDDKKDEDDKKEDDDRKDDDKKDDDGKKDDGDKGNNSSRRASRNRSYSISIAETTTGKWTKDSKGWSYIYSNGTKAIGTETIDVNGKKSEHIKWVEIDNSWWAFGTDAYLKTGWINDTDSHCWYYVDENSGMLTGWHNIDDKWYYFSTLNGGPLGSMLYSTRTPDGYYVGADGAWIG